MKRKETKRKENIQIHAQAHNTHKAKLNSISMSIDSWLNEINSREKKCINCILMCDVLLKCF